MKKIIKDIKGIFNSILWNWQMLLLFELIYRIFGGIFIFPVLSSLINFTINKANLRYINMETLAKWIISPLTIPVLIGCFFILGIYIILEIIVLIQYFYSAKIKEQINIKEFLLRVKHNIYSIIIPKNWLIFLFIMMLFPITILSIKPDAIASLRTPEYILDFIRDEKRLYIL